MYKYSAYGLGIHSDLHIQELSLQPEAQADVTVRVGPESRVSDVGDDGPCTFATRDEARFAWEKIAAFRVRHGCEIDIRPHPDVDRELLRLPLLGVIFGALLHQRGRIVLHASSVLINGQAVAFVGNKGFGKSTLAAAMYRLGYAVLGDDVAAIELREGAGPFLYPAYPHLNVWPHAARFLGDDPDRLRPLHKAGVKRSLPVEQSFPDGAVPLRAIYLLDFGPEISSQPLKGVEAFAQLVPHCYAARYFSEMEDIPQRLMASCGELIREVPIHRLTRRDAVGDAFESAHQIEMNASRQPSDSPRHVAA